MGYDNIVETGQLKKYCAKWRKRKLADQKWSDFWTCFTEFNKERKDYMTIDEPSYSLNQFQEMVRTRIQTETAAWFQEIIDENSDPNIPPTHPPPASANALTRNLDHDSKTCTRRLDGHKEEATLNNKMGGLDGQINISNPPEAEK